MERYHGIKISCSSAYRTLVRNGVGPLLKKAGRRAIHTRRYAKEVPGHHDQTDRGHEFQAQFHWHVEDKGMQNVYVKPRSPQPNGKVERSHRRSHGAYNGKTPYETLKRL